MALTDEQVNEILKNKRGPITSYKSKDLLAFMREKGYPNIQFKRTTNYRPSTSYLGMARALMDAIVYNTLANGADVSISQAFRLRILECDGLIKGFSVRPGAELESPFEKTRGYHILCSKHKYVEGPISVRGMERYFRRFLKYLTSLNLPKNTFEYKPDAVRYKAVKLERFIKSKKLTL